MFRLACLFLCRSAAQEAQPCALPHPRRSRAPPCRRRRRRLGAQREAGGHAAAATTAACRAALPGGWWGAAGGDRGGMGMYSCYKPNTLHGVLWEHSLTCIVWLGICSLGRLGPSDTTYVCLSVLCRSAWCSIRCSLALPSSFLLLMLPLPHCPPCIAQSAEERSRSPRSPSSPPAFCSPYSAQPFTSAGRPPPVVTVSSPRTPTFASPTPLYTPAVGGKARSPVVLAGASSCSCWPIRESGSCRIWAP